MKRFFALLMILILALASTGCGDDANQNDSTIKLTTNNYKSYLHIEYDYIKTESDYLLGMPYQSGYLNYSIYATQPGSFSNVSIMLRFKTEKPWSFYESTSSNNQYISMNVKLPSNGTYSSSTRMGAISGNTNPPVTLEVVTVSGEFIPTN